MNEGLCSIGSVMIWVIVSLCSKINEVKELNFSESSIPDSLSSEIVLIL